MKEIIANLSDNAKTELFENALKYNNYRVVEDNLLHTLVTTEKDIKALSQEIFAYYREKYKKTLL